VAALVDQIGRDVGATRSVLGLEDSPAPAQVPR